jgi:ADP-ribose pyrophosphatase
MNLKLLKRDVLYKGKVVDLIVDQVEYPSGNKGVREVLAHPGGAAVLALFPGDRILFVKQHRYPINKVLYELPAGKLSPGEDPQVCALRELTEETGYVARKIQKITSIYTTPGFCNECLHLYLATDLHYDKPNREEGEEHIQIEIMQMERAIEMIEKGEINDSKTVVGILLGKRILNK